MNSSEKIIGGFFPLAVNFQKISRNFFSLWGNGLLFHNARSSLNYLLRNISTNKIWLPAYICDDVIDAVAGTSEFDFYPVGTDLSPDINFLKSHMSKGEAVLVVDYFGKPPAKNFRKFARKTKDIIWIEDRAQAIYPAKKSYGDYIIYSPRKVLGVPDGGILISKKNNLPKPSYQKIASANFAAAPLMRFEDYEESGNWYGIFREYEDNMGVSLLPISRISQEILVATNPSPIIKKRRENYKILHESLKNIALFKKAPKRFAPFGFPIVVNNRDEVLRKLHENKIFAACHWKNIPSPEDKFTFEHKLASSIITIPCDHRYSRKDMEHIISFISNYIKNV